MVPGRFDVGRGSHGAPNKTCLREIKGLQTSGRSEKDRANQPLMYQVKDNHPQHVTSSQVYTNIHFRTDAKQRKSIESRGKTRFFDVFLFAIRLHCTKRSPERSPCLHARHRLLSGTELEEQRLDTVQRRLFHFGREPWS